MFESNLVEGVARCTFSGYVGFGGKHLSTFEKPASQVHSDIAMNAVSGGALVIIAKEIIKFFKPFTVSSRELMSDIHYVRDCLLVSLVPITRCVQTQAQSKCRCYPDTIAIRACCNA